MKNNTPSYLALLLIAPCSLAQESPQEIDNTASSHASNVVEIQVVPTEVAATEFANLDVLQTQQGGAPAELNQATSVIKNKDLELGIADLQNRLAELNAASRQQQEILQIRIQKMLEAQKEAQRAAKGHAQAQAEGRVGSGFGVSSAGGSGGGFDSFATSVDVGAAPPNWLIGVQVQNQGDQGLKVVSLSEGFPASDAGFKREDVILSANGLKLKNSETLRHLIQAAEDQQLEFLIKRGEEAPIKLQVIPSKNKETAYRYRPIRLSTSKSHGNPELSLTISPVESQSEARLKKNLDQHPELKQLLNDYFEKHQQEK